MNHYPHHIGDFAKDTLGFNQGAIGAYRLLMDAYYANEQAIAAEDAYVIGRATTPAERKNVDKALTKFELKDGRYHHKRVEEELDAYRDRSETGRKNVAKRYQKTTESTLASSHKPVTSNQEKQRFPDMNQAPDSVGTACAAAFENLKTKALTLNEAKIPGGQETPAGVLASVLLANGVKGNAFHPLVVEWAREGVTVEKLKDAIAKARQRPGKETGTFGVAYLDPIIHDETKPAAQVAVEKSSEAARKAVAKTQRLIAEQREREASPMPESLRPKASA